jgi:hypothetical protein
MHRNGSFNIDCYHVVFNLQPARIVKIKIHKFAIFPVVLYGCQTLLSPNMWYRLRNNFSCLVLCLPATCFDPSGPSSGGKMLDSSKLWGLLLTSRTTYNEPRISEEPNIVPPEDDPEGPKQVVVRQYTTKHKKQLRRWYHMCIELHSTHQDVKKFVSHITK